MSFDSITARFLGLPVFGMIWKLTRWCKIFPFNIPSFLKAAEEPKNSDRPAHNCSSRPYNHHLDSSYWQGEGTDHFVLTFDLLPAKTFCLKVKDGNPGNGSQGQQGLGKTWPAKQDGGPAGQASLGAASQPPAAAAAAPFASITEDAFSIPVRFVVIQLPTWMLLTKTGGEESPV